MPELNRVQVVQLIILLLAVPVQYLLTQSSTENGRKFELKRVITGIFELNLNSYIDLNLNSYIDLKGWFSWCRKFLLKFDDLSRYEPALQVLKTQDENGHFASSKKIRSPRPSNAHYRVGQVIKHRIHGYRGVIIGWDETAKAPKTWLNTMHKDRPDWRLLPNYAVLIDTRDRLTPQLAYVVGENILAVENVRIMHPLVEHYFEDWDGTQYLMRPWIRKIYPHD